MFYNVNHLLPGGQGKSKRKFSIRAQSHDDSLFKDSSDAHESHESIKVSSCDATEILNPFLNKI